MNWKSTSLKVRLLSFFFAVSYFFATSPWALAAAKKDEEPASDPVWVMSWASFIIFGAATIMICVIFSRRRDSILTQEEQKHVNQLRADRATKRRKEERFAQIHGQKK